jgi:protein TonB
MKIAEWISQPMARALGASALLHGVVAAVALGLFTPDPPFGETIGLDVTVVTAQGMVPDAPLPPAGAPQPVDGTSQAPAPAASQPEPAPAAEPVPEPAPKKPAAAPAKPAPPAPAPASDGADRAEAQLPPPASGVTLLQGLPPSYPAGARREGLEGKVIVRVIVSGEGKPSSVRLLASSGYPVLDRAALDAVAQWRFRASGRVEIDVPIQFRLEDANR